MEIITKQEGVEILADLETALKTLIQNEFNFLELEGVENKNDTN